MFKVLILFTFISVLLGVEVGNLQTISIVGTSDTSTIELGYIEFDKATSTAIYLETNKIDGKVCLSANITNHDCFATTDSLNGKQFLVTLKDGAIDYLSLIQSKGNHQKVRVEEIKNAPQPILTPNNIDNKNKKTARPQADAETEPEVEKSFIQKYWTYIVPALIIFLVMLGDGDNK